MPRLKIQSMKSGFRRNRRWQKYDSLMEQALSETLGRGFDRSKELTGVEVLGAVDWLCLHFKVEPDTAARAFVLSMVLRSHADEVLADFNLDAAELKVVTKRYRDNEVWADDRPPSISCREDCMGVVMVGRGLATSTWCPGGKELRYKLTLAGNAFLDSLAVNSQIRK